VSSGYIPAKDEPGPDEILEAVWEAIFDNPRLIEMPSEEVARQLILGGYLQEEPSPALVADHAAGPRGRGRALIHELPRRVSSRKLGGIKAGQSSDKEPRP
jgi:hypothetical protein